MFSRHGCDKCNYEDYTPCPDHSDINPRIKYHRMLDEAMDETEEGKFFISTFIEKLMQELLESKKNMTISLKDFNGDKDNYYNFKRCFLQSREYIRQSDCYCGEKDKIRNLVHAVWDEMIDVEFED